jgi:hypothetical protein
MERGSIYGHLPQREPWSIKTMETMGGITALTADRCHIGRATLPEITRVGDPDAVGTTPFPVGTGDEPFSTWRPDPRTTFDCVHALRGSRN